MTRCWNGEGSLLSITSLPFNASLNLSWTMRVTEGVKGRRTSVVKLNVKNQTQQPKVKSCAPRSLLMISTQLKQQNSF